MASYSEMLLGPKKEEPPERAPEDQPQERPSYSQMLLAPQSADSGFARRLAGEGKSRPVPNYELANKAAQPVSEARKIVSLSEARRKEFANQERADRGTGLLPAVGGFVEDVSNAVRGEPQFLEPEKRGGVLGIGEEAGTVRAPSFGAAAKIGAGLTLTTDPVRQIEIIKSADPGAEFKVSERGNIMVRFSNQGDFAFLNKPGITFTDIQQGLAQILQYAGGAKLAGALAKRGIKSALTQGAAAAGVSVGQDVGAQALGSKEPIDLVKATLTGIFGAGADVLMPAVSALWRRLPFSKGIVNPDGTLTAQGIEAARRAGIEPGDIAPEVLKALDDFAGRFSPKQLEKVFSELGRQARGEAEAVTGKATSEEAAARAARAKEFGIDLMEPQARRDFRGMARIEEIGADAQGNTAGELVRQRVATQGKQVEQAAEKLSMAGQAEKLVDDIQGAGGQVTADLRERAAEVGKQVDAAYEAVRGRKAYIGADGVPDFAKATIAALRDADALVSAELTPGTAAIMRKVQALARTARKQIKEPNVNARLEFRRFERLRRELNQRINAAESAGRGDDKFYLTTIKRELDGFLDDAFDNALFQGDEATLALMKQARAARTEYGKLFEARSGDAGAGKVIDKMINQDITNQEAANWVFGTSKIGETGVAVRVVKRLKNIFGTDSEQWQMLRQGAMQRIIYGARPKGNQIQSIGRLSSDLKQAIEGRGKEYMQVLFSPEELRQLRRYASTLDDILPPPGATNPSRTAYAVSRVMQDTAKNMLTAVGAMSGGLGGGLATRAAGEAVTRSASSLAGRTVTRTVEKGLPAPRISPLFPGAAIAAGREGYQPFQIAPPADRPVQQIPTPQERPRAE